MPYSPSFTEEVDLQRRLAAEQLDAAERSGDAGSAATARARLADLDDIVARSGVVLGVAAGF